MSKQFNQFMTMLASIYQSLEHLLCQFTASYPSQTNQCRMNFTTNKSKSVYMLRFTANTSVYGNNLSLELNSPVFQRRTGLNG